MSYIIYLGNSFLHIFILSTVPTLEYDSSKRLISKYFEKSFIYDTLRTLFLKTNIDVLNPTKSKHSIDATPQIVRSITISRSIP